MIFKTLNLAVPTNPNSTILSERSASWKNIRNVWNWLLESGEMRHLPFFNLSFICILNLSGALPALRVRESDAEDEYKREQISQSEETWKCDGSTMIGSTMIER